LGHGKSPIPNDASLYPSTPSRLSEDINGLIRHFSLSEPIDIVGHAGGGLIGVQFAQDYPDKVKTIILLAPPPLPPSLEGMDEFVRIIRERGQVFWRDWMCSCLGQKAQGSSEIRALADELASEFDVDGAVRHIGVMKGFQLGDPPIPDGVEAVVVFGNQDTVSTPEIAENVAKSLDSRLLEVDSGHYMTLEEPRAVARLLESV
jgi:pimeloyl-ACP methyl ester carboxylesterase